jgi:hypothetical protein
VIGVIRKYSINESEFLQEVTEATESGRRNKKPNDHDGFLRSLRFLLFKTFVIVFLNGLMQAFNQMIYRRQQRQRSSGSMKKKKPEGRNLKSPSLRVLLSKIPRSELYKYTRFTDRIFYRR